MNEASIVYSASPGQARLQRNTVSKRKKKERERQSGRKRKGGRGKLREDRQTK